METGTFTAPKQRTIKVRIESIEEIEYEDKTFYDLVVEDLSGNPFFVSASTALAEDLAEGMSGYMLVDEHIGGVTNYLSEGRMETHRKTGLSLVKFAPTGNSKRVVIPASKGINKDSQPSKSEVIEVEAEETADAIN